MARELLDSPIWVIGGIATVLMVAAAEARYWLGRRSTSCDSGVGAVKAAVLALVGLLLAFSYSIAASHYDRRKYVVVDEAASLITCWQRADLAEEPGRSRARVVLGKIVDARLRSFSRDVDPAEAGQIEADIVAFHRELWAIAAGQLNGSAEPEKHMLLAQSVNDVIARSADRASVNDHRVPGAVIFLLTGSVLVSGFLIGVSSGQDNRRIPLLWAIVIVLMVAVLVTIIDIDNPGHGLIVDRPEPLERVKADLVGSGG